MRIARLDNITVFQIYKKEYSTECHLSLLRALSSQDFRMGSSKKKSKKGRSQESEDERNSIHGDSMDGVDEEFSLEVAMVEFPLTDECHHYTSIKEVPWDIQK